MTYSNEFATTLATIAAKAQSRWAFMAPDQSVEFAWFSVNSVGDAAEDNEDLVRHFKDWVETKGFGIPPWMIAR